MGAPQCPMPPLPACQAARLYWVALIGAIRSLWCALCALVRLALGKTAEDHMGVEFFDGHVTHVRSHEGSHAFSYPVRMAVIDLDSPPPWWRFEPVARLSATEARAAAGTEGRVRLLTTPSSAEYEQNPIQIYYCEDLGGGCSRGVCEVTNTPWNHRVYFAFDLVGAELAKPLHVSPLMDIDQRWWVRATPPAADGLELDVDVLPVSRGDINGDAPLLRARLRLQRSSWPRARAEHAASFLALWRYGFQPQRTAVLIYFNALKLLAKGIKFRRHPAPEYKECVLRRAVSNRRAGKPSWIDNETFPFGHRAPVTPSLE